VGIGSGGLVYGGVTGRMDRWVSDYGVSCRPEKERFDMQLVCQPASLISHI
jgi:hypothetical protein